MPKFDSRQTSFDLSCRGERLRLLDQIDLPKVPGTSPAAMLSVLRRLDHHSRTDASCRVSIAKLAEGAKLSTAAVKRAINGLKMLDLIIVSRTGRSSSYRIAWSNFPREGEQIEAPQAPAIAHGDPSDSSSCAIRELTLRHLIAQDELSTEASSETSLEPPPQTKAKAWQEAEEAVGSIPGIVKPKTAIAAARSAGVEPGYVIDCVLFFQSLPGAFGPGALVDRLREASPLRAPKDPLTWHPPRPPSAREAQALNVLARVRDWCHDHGKFDRDEILCTFDAAAVTEKYGAFTPQEIQRAKFDAARHPDFFREPHDVRIATTAIPQ